MTDEQGVVCTGGVQNASEPNIAEWLAAARHSSAAPRCGMFLTHCGVVRLTPKAAVRGGVVGLPNVTALRLTYRDEDLAAAVEEARALPGVEYVRAWVNRGVLGVGDAMMYVLIGADIRPRCVDALQWLVEKIKTDVVTEEEIF